MRKILIVFLPIIMSVCVTFTSTSQGLDTYLSEEVQIMCNGIGKKYNICPELLMAMIETESSGNPNAQNGSCKGLMQISEKWHKDRMEKLGVTDIYDEYGNILLGADYLTELIAKYHDIGLVLDVYNGNRKAHWNAQVGILSDYAEKILTRSAELEELHGK